MRPASELSPQAAPVCPKHPGVPSVAPCARCGTFLCNDCMEVRDPPLCAACALKAQDPLGVRTETFSLGGSIRNGWRLFRAALPTVAVMAVVFGIPSGLISHALSGVQGNFDRVTNLYDATIGLIGLIGVIWAMAAAAEGRRVSLGDAFRTGLSAWGRVFFARFRSGLWILLFTLLLIIPGIIKALALLMVTPAAILHPGRDPLEESSWLTEGRKGELFLFCLAGGLLAFGGIFPVAFGVGMLESLLPAMAAPAAVLLDVAIRAAGYLFEAMSLAAYYGLTRRRQLE